MSLHNQPFPLCITSLKLFLNRMNEGNQCLDESFIVKLLSKIFPRFSHGGLRVDVATYA